MIDVTTEGSGYMLRLQRLGPVFEYGNASDDNEEALIEGPKKGGGNAEEALMPKSDFVLYTVSELMAKRFSQAGGPLWDHARPSNIRNRRTVKRREWGFVVLVFGLGYLNSGNDRVAETAAENSESSFVVYWNPVIWCVANPDRCHGGKFNSLFLEHASVDRGVKADEFIRMRSDDSVIVPNIPPITHFAAEER